MELHKKSKIKLALLGHGIISEPIFKELRDNFVITTPQKADSYIIVNYGKIIKQKEIERLKYPPINIHGSLLPKYRGSTPVQTAIKNNDSLTGFSIIQIDRKVDHGPILFSRKVKITKTDTTDDLLKKLGLSVARIITDILTRYFNNQITAKQQRDKSATYTQKNDKPIVLDFQESRQKIYNYYRAYYKEPGLFIKLEDDSLIKIIKANNLNHFTPILVQKPGKKIINYNNFLNGYRNHPPF